MFCSKCGQSVSSKRNTYRERAEGLEHCLLLLRDKVKWDKNYAGVPELVNECIKEFGFSRPKET